jgi:hypothetical protein
MIVRLDGGTETLDEYVEGTFMPIHVAPLAEKTRRRYAGLYDGYISPGLGGYALRELTEPEIIGRWQADQLAASARAREHARDPRSEDPPAPHAAALGPSAGAAGAGSARVAACVRAAGRASR